MGLVVLHPSSQRSGFWDSWGDQMAMAAKLARLVYRMLRHGMKYVDQGAELYETQHRKQQVIHLKQKAAQLGLQIIEVAAAA
jgi:predicted regulator of amino acid metabolism with ACT domain